MDTPHAAPTAGPRHGAAVALDTIIAPQAAFATLRERPSWLWAFVITTVLGVIGSFATIPASRHAIVTSGPALYSKQFANLPPDQRDKSVAQAVAIGSKVVGFAWISVPFGILLVAAIQALVMLIGSAAGGGDRGFGHYFALSMNVFVPGYGLFAIALAILITLRGADSFNAVSDIAGAMPSLALIAPGASPAATAFLDAINPFTIWATVLLGLGMTGVGRLKPAVAYGTAAILLLISAALPAVGALAQKS